MGKTVLAFDIGDTYIKIAKQEKDRIRIICKQMPEDLVKDGIVQLPHMLEEFLKDIRKEYKLPKAECGIVVPDEEVVCRKLTLPAMTEKQLEVNLPFEFSDFISGKPTRYVYDYAMEQIIEDESGKPKEMVLTGAVMSKDAVTNYVDMFRAAGFKLRTLIPQEIALTNIVKEAVANNRIDPDQEFCLVNLGHRATQVYIFKGETLVVLRKIYIGGESIDKAIAEHEIIDEYLARTHKNTNYNDVLESEYCKEAFGKIAVEIMKVINFYKFNNRESNIEDIYFCGGGSNILQLCDHIAAVNGLDHQPINRLLPINADKNMDLSAVCAMGVLLQ